MAFKFLTGPKVNGELRMELSKPFGEVMSQGQLSSRINRLDIKYAVGDATIYTLLRLGCKPKIAIFDHMAASK